MKIVSLHIYGFGKFIDQKFDVLSPNIQLFFGENEAGKSTILAFIRAIFFGFPTKQSKEERYEPKTSSSYGGKITLETEQYGKIAIERVKGSRKGDVKVYMPDGTVRGEEQLKKILIGMDRTVYQGVFSFGLQDLNDVSQVHSEELGKYLYGVGMVGRSSIVSLEKELMKKQDELFKPQGKKPIINHILNEMEHLNNKIIELKEEERTYHEWYEEKERVAIVIDELKEKIRQLQVDVQEYEMIDRLKPHVRKRHELQNQLQQYDPLLNDFPLEGEKVLDELRIKIETIEERLLELEKKKEQLQQTEKRLLVNETILQAEGEWKAFQKNVALYEQIMSEKQTIVQTLASEKEELVNIVQQLGDDFTEQTIEHSVTTVQAKEELKQLVQKEKRITEQEEHLIEEIRQRQFYLTEKELQKKNIENRLASLRKKEHIQKELQYIYDALKERSLLQQEITFLKAEQLHKNDTKQKPLLLYIAIFLFIVFAVIGVVLNEWLVVATSVVTVLILLVIFKQLTRKKVKNTNETLLKEKLARYDLLEKEHLEEKEKKFVFELEQVTNLEKQCEQLESQYEFEVDFLSRMKQKKNDLEEQMLNLRDDLVHWCNNYHFPPIPKAQVLQEIFSLIVEGKKRLATMNEQNNRLREIEQFETHFLQEKRKIAAIIAENPQSSPYNIAENFMKKLEVEKNKVIEKEQINKQLRQMKDEVAILLEKKTYFQKERNALFQKANVDNEQQFYKQLQAYNERRELEKELGHCQTHIATICPDEEKLAYFERKMALSEEKGIFYEQIARELEQAQHELKLQESKYIELSVKLEQLEETTTYSEIVQQFEMKKTKLKEKAKEWAICRLSLQLLEDAKRIYETERQPFVIKKAQQFFSIMTDGEYEQLFAPVEENTFIVQNKNGLRFTPSELSQGTREQLYLSLRLALACAYQQYVSFPIILDDIFVNFDAKRAKAAKNVIVEMAKDHQIIFFTCHEHMCSLFSEFAIFRM